MSSPFVRRRLTTAICAATAVTLASGLAAVPAQAADTVTINLFTFNDFHGRIENEAGGSPAGIAALAGAIEQVRSGNPNTVVAAAGDLVGASTFTSFIQNDEPAIAGLTAAGLDVSSVGNHEFDQGWADLKDRIQPMAGWQYIAANLHDKATGEPIMPEYYTQTFDGVTIGFIGAVTNELPSLVSPAGIDSVVVGDVADNVNRVADDLRDGDPTNGEADVVVLLVHEGAATTDIASATDPSSAFGRIVTQVDSDVNAIVSGHTHLAYNHVINGRPVISSGQYGEKFSDMVIKVDAATKQLQSMTNTTYSMKTDGVLNYPEVQSILDQIVKPAQEVAAEKGKVSLGTITANFNRAKQANGTSENRGGESPLGNWVADVQLWAAQRDKPATQIAFMNPGGLRADMTYASSGEGDPDGNVTYKEAAAVQPFANTLVTLTMTGAQLKTVLEQQWQPAGASRPFLKLGVSKGFEYTFNPANPAGQRITSITLNDKAIDPAASYEIVVNSFLASGGDNFGAFAEGANRADSGLSDLTTVVDWFVANPTASPDLAQRAVGVAASAPAAPAGYVAGETITLTLSGLDFTTSETPAGTVTATLGKATATAPIDRTPTVADDLTGTATVSVKVPTGLTGAQNIAITTPSGTSVTVPVTIQTPVVSKDTKVIAVPNKTLINTKQTTMVSVFVTSQTRPLSGKVALYDGNKLIGSAMIDSSGYAKIKVSKLTAGVHKMTPKFEGTASLNASTGPTFPILVW